MTKYDYFFTQTTMSDLETKIEKVYDFFGDKTLKFGCIIDDLEGCGEHIFTGRRDDGLYETIDKDGYRSICSPQSFKILGSPIMPHHIAFKIAQRYADDEFHGMIGENCFTFSGVPRLLRIWESCGADKSLQEIFTELVKYDEGTYAANDEYVRLQALLDFLYSLTQEG